MYFTTLVISLISLATLGMSAAIGVRDNACTACLAMISKAELIPSLFDPAVSDSEKECIMRNQVCASDDLKNTPLSAICESYVTAWSPALYQYFGTMSFASPVEPQVVCAQPNFRAC